MAERRENWTEHLQLGLELAVGVIVFFFIGYIIDLYFNTKPYFTLIGSVFGIVSVFYIIWKRFLK